MDTLLGILTGEGVIVCVLVSASSVMTRVVVEVGAGAVVVMVIWTFVHVS